MTMSQSRLYLITPQGGDDQLLCDVLHAVVEAGDIAALLVRAENTEKLMARMQILQLPAQDNEIAVLIEEDATLARQSGADGVHVTGNIDTVSHARNIVGENMIVGVNPGNSRHDAMEAAEAQPDYVAFDSHDMALWWAPLFEIPCVDMEAANFDDAKTLVAAGTEFICPINDIWANPSDASEAVKHYNELLSSTGDPV